MGIVEMFVLVIKYTVYSTKPYNITGFYSFVVVSVIVPLSALNFYQMSDYYRNHGKKRSCIL